MEILLDRSGRPVILAQDDAEPPPAVVGALELARRADAVRGAAREYEDLSEQDVRERLRGTTSRALTRAEIAEFRQDVREQVLNDLVDILDQRHLGPLRKRRRVRVMAPKGYVRMTIKGLADDEAEQVRDRLRARGWGTDDVRSVLPVAGL